VRRRRRVSADEVRVRVLGAGFIAGGEVAAWRRWRRLAVLERWGGDCASLTRSGEEGHGVRTVLGEMIVVLDLIRTGSSSTRLKRFIGVSGAIIII
jgi:hypothetical protein